MVRMIMEGGEEVTMNRIVFLRMHGGRVSMQHHLTARRPGKILPKVDLRQKSMPASRSPTSTRSASTQTSTRIYRECGATFPLRHVSQAQSAEISH